MELPGPICGEAAAGGGRDRFARATLRAVKWDYNKLAVACHFRALARLHRRLAGITGEYDEHEIGATKTASGQSFPLNNSFTDRCTMEKLRIDKWLWAARFYKTRSLAATEIGKGRILVNDQPAKPAREVSIGDLVSVRRDQTTTVVEVRALSAVRGPAPVARTLYEETEDSRLARESAQEQRRLAGEPALSIAQGRPTKHDRRQLELAKKGFDW